jgi:hypothetical protein
MRDIGVGVHHTLGTAGATGRKQEVAKIIGADVWRPGKIMIRSNGLSSGHDMVAGVARRNFRHVGAISHYDFERAAGCIEKRIETALAPTVDDHCAAIRIF